jgi:hypothetical protein
MTRAAVIDKVMVKLDELTPFDEALVISSGNDGVMPLREYIDSILNETTKEHLRNCPLKWITAINIGDITLATLSAQATMFTLTKPTDGSYIKIHTVKHSTWARGIQTAITLDDPRYKLQNNIYTRGTINKPVVVDMGSTLDCYSIVAVADPAETGTFKYVKYLIPESINDDNTVDMITTLAAYKVLAIMHELDHAKAMFEMYKLQLGV